MASLDARTLCDFIDLLSESALVLDLEGNIHGWNAAAETLYGVTGDTVRGRTLAEVFGAEAMAGSALESVAQQGHWEGDVLRPGPDGRMCNVALRWRLLGHEDTGRILETGRDVTAMRAAEAALKKSEHRYRNLFQAMAASFWELDFFPVGDMLYRLKKSGTVGRFDTYFADHPEFVRDMMRATRVIDVNEQTVALFGRGNKAELLTSVEPFWPEASSRVFAESVVAAVTGASHYASETRLRRIDGQTFPALFTACFPPDTMNKGTLLVGVIDLSAQVAAQEELARMQADLARSARISLLGELAASIAHEVNQPLGAIAANAAAGQRWLSRDVPDLEEVGAIIGRIASDTGRAADTIARVRAMASGAAPDPRAIDANSVVEDTATFLQHEIRQAGARLVLNLSSETPRIHADRVQMQQVIVNLALNGLQAMAGCRSPELILSTTVEARQVLIRVEDNGPGISDDIIARLFDSFFTTRAGGMGLGLAIARSIVFDAGGKIHVENRAGGGARFLITLPSYTPVEVDHTKV